MGKYKDHVKFKIAIMMSILFRKPTSLWVQIIINQRFSMDPKSWDYLKERITDAI
jgi:hypothetical protein